MKTVEPAQQPPVNQEPHVPQQNYERRTLQAFRRIIRAIDRNSHKLASRHKITGPQLGCLQAIKDHGPITSARLAQQIFLSPSTIVGIIDRLEEKKLVERNRDRKDRRLIHICITPAGEHLVAEAPSLLQDTLIDALAELPDTERISITLTLEKLVDLMEIGHIAAAPLLTTGPLQAKE